MRGTKYLSDIMKEIELSKDKNNLLISPIGCGKTHYAINVLSQDKRVIYLCDNSNLKTQLLEHDRTQSTYDNKLFQGFSKTEITVMTYKEFGRRVKYDVNDEYINTFDLIIADEIHSLVEYMGFNNDVELAHALRFLLSLHKIPIIMMTATEYYLTKLMKDYPNLYDNFNVIDLSDNKEIRRYGELRREYINHFSQIKTHLKAYETGFKYLNMKCLIYTKKIEDMEKLNDICEELELKPICIWSINNQRKLNDEQNKVREHLLKEYELLDPYNVLIINKSSETGINIHDEDMKLCLVNSTNPTEITQARGRIRHDVDLLVVRTNSNKLPKTKLTVDDKYLNEYISKDEVYKLIARYDIKNERGKLIGLRAFIDTLRNSGYRITSKRKRVKGQQDMYYLIEEIKKNK